MNLSQASASGVIIPPLREQLRRGSMSPLFPFSSSELSETNLELAMKQELEIGSISHLITPPSYLRQGSLSSLSSLETSWTNEGANVSSAANTKLRRTKRKSAPIPAFRSKRVKNEHGLPVKRPLGRPRKHPQVGSGVKGIASTSKSVPRSATLGYSSCEWPEMTSDKMQREVSTLLWLFRSEL